MENIQVPQLKPIYDVTMYTDFRHMLHTISDTYGDKDAFILKHKGAGRKAPATYEHVSFRSFRSMTESLGAELLHMGFQGQRIAIIGNNSMEWMLSYFAVLGGLGIAVPLDKGLPYEEILTSVRQSETKVLIFEKKLSSLVEKLKQEEDMPVSTFICMTELEGYESISQLITRGEALLSAGERDYLTLPIDPDEVTIYLFTSGTTSAAKIVMLSQRNVIFDFVTMMRVLEFRKDDVCMAFLPYHHTYGAGGQLIMLSCGATTVYCDGLKYIQKNMVEYGVSTFIGVPLLVEAIWKKVVQTIEKQGKTKTFQRGIRISNFLRKLGIDKRRSLFKEIHESLGGKLRAIFCGASALDPQCQMGFDAIGIPVYQGYGMTEASPVLCTESTNVRRVGSIGQAMPGMDVQILNPNEEGIGELIAKAPNVMHGYYNNPEETAKTLVDGWLHTGDLGKMDKDGFVFLTGRAKNVIVLRNGKNVYPEEIETLIANLPYVKENIVIGEPKHEDDNWNDLALVAKIVYDRSYFESIHGITEEQDIYEFIKKDMDSINATMPSYKQVLRIRIQETEMIKTTTGKVKRFQEGAR